MVMMEHGSRRTKKALRCSNGKHEIYNGGNSGVYILFQKVQWVFEPSHANECVAFGPLSINQKAGQIRRFARNCFRSNQ